MPLHRPNDRAGQILHLEQAPKVQQCGRVRRGLPAQIDSDERPDRLAVVNGVLGLIPSQEVSIRRCTPTPEFVACPAH